MKSYSNSGLHMAALYLLTAMITLYGGLHMIGLLAPVEVKMNAEQFAQNWQIVDGYMGKRMPVYGLSMLFLFVLNLFLFRKAWRSLFYGLLAASLLTLLGEVAFAIVEQGPINDFIQKLDVNNLTDEQIQAVEGMRIATLKNFDLRNWIAVCIALAVLVCPFLLAKFDRETA